MATPHIEANKNDFAKTVLMPGDPLRSKFIAENFLSETRLVNNVRGVQGYTGLYKGEKVSVMASGMGMPSIGIYAYELYSFFGVENIIRVGTAGGISDKVKIKDIVLGMGACTDSNFASQYGVNGNLCPTASFALLSAAYDRAKELGFVDSGKIHVGNIYSTDIFYNDDKSTTANKAKMGTLAVEMEAAALYLTALRLGKNALAICTISDHIITGECTPALERQTSFTDMMTLALETSLTFSLLNREKSTLFDSLT